MKSAAFTSKGNLNRRIASTLLSNSPERSSSTVVSEGWRNSASLSSIDHSLIELRNSASSVSPQRYLPAERVNRRGHQVGRPRFRRLDVPPERRPAEPPANGR